MDAGDGLTVFDDKVYTVDDYMKLDDGNFYELIGGKLIMTPSPSSKHQKIALNIATSFKNFLQQNPIGEIYYDLDVHVGDRVVRPDVLFVAKERIDIIGEYLDAAPDLVVEILSPSTTMYDKKTKSQIYLSNGVKEYWVVDPECQLIEVFKTGDNAWIYAGIFGARDILTTSLLPGLELNVGKIFGA